MIQVLLGNKVFKNFSFLTIGSILAQLISLFTILKITRILSPSEYGIFTFMLMQGALLSAIGDLGMNNIVIRSIARDYNKTNDLIHNGLVMKVIAVLILSFLYIGYNFWLGSLSSEQLILIFVYSLAVCLYKLFENAYVGHERMLPNAIISVSQSILWFSAVFLLPESLVNFTNLFYIYLGISIARALAYYILLHVHKLLKGEIQRFWRTCKVVLNESWPYFVMVVIMLPFTKFSNNFLDLNSTSEQVGYFNLSERLLGPVSMVLDFALAALFPNLSAIWAKDQERFKGLIRNGFKYFMLVSMVLCFLFTLFSYDVILFLFPESYLPAVKVCQLQVWYIFLTSVDSFIGTILGSVNKEKLILRLNIVNAIFSTPLLYFGSQYGAIGLASAFVIGFGVFQFYLWYIFGKSLKIRIAYGGFLWIIAILLFVSSYFLIPHENTLMLRLTLALSVVGGAGYFIAKTYRSVLLK